MIAHRLATVRRADVIFVLNDGVISEKGAHEELLAHDRLHARLYRMQFRVNDPARDGTDTRSAKIAAC